mmetsp:Transcript_38287/g.94988  ORF Transcript_38287/g.94988 Transcript_38287/m.94988 type:complete len:494 (+) Transcript_38287:522-2003(+)
MAFFSATTASKLATISPPFAASNSAACSSYILMSSSPSGSSLRSTARAASLDAAHLASMASLASGVAPTSAVSSAATSLRSAALSMVYLARVSRMLFSALSLSRSKWSLLAATAFCAASQSFLAALASLTSLSAAALLLAASACALRSSSRASSASSTSFSFAACSSASSRSTASSSALTAIAASRAALATRALRASCALRASGAKSPALMEAPASSVISSSACASASCAASRLAFSISFTSVLMLLRPVTRAIMLAAALSSSSPILDDLPRNLARIFSSSAPSSLRNMVISSLSPSGMLIEPSGAPSRHSCSRIWLNMPPTKSADSWISFTTEPSAMSAALLSLVPSARPFRWWYAISGSMSASFTASAVSGFLSAKLAAKARHTCAILVLGGTTSIMPLITSSTPSCASALWHATLLLARLDSPLMAFSVTLAACFSSRVSLLTSALSLGMTPAMDRICLASASSRAMCMTAVTAGSVSLGLRSLAMRSTR